MLHVLWLRRPQDEPHIAVAHPDSNFCFTRLWDLRTLVFIEICFLSWHLMPMSGNIFSIHGTNRKHAQYVRVRSWEVDFYAIVHVVLQRCAPSFAQNRFVMYITHVHRYVCYVFHFVMYIISFLCRVSQSFSMFAPICYKGMFMSFLCT